MTPSTINQFNERYFFQGPYGFITPSFVNPLILSPSMKSPELAVKIIQILNKHKSKRIIILGTTCTGKSTLHRLIPGSVDMDEAVFPLLTKEESDYVCQNPWTEEIGKKMDELVRNKVKVEPGHPMLGTVVVDCNLIIILKITDKLLKERCKKREVNFDDAKRMETQILGEAKASGIPIELVNVR